MSRRIRLCNGYKTWCSNFLSFCSCWLGYSPRRISPDICILVWYISCTWIYILLSMCDKLIGKPILRPKLIDFRENTKYILPYHKALSYVHIRRKCSVIEKLYSSFSKFLKAVKGFRTSEYLVDKCISVIEPLFLLLTLLLFFDKIFFDNDILKILDH